MDLDPALHELLRNPPDPQDREVEALIRLDRPTDDVAGVRIVSRFGPVATCRLPWDQLLAIRRHHNVASLKGPDLVGPEPDPSTLDPGPAGDLPLRVLDSDGRRPPGVGLTGSGVVVGVVDWGCDPLHPNLRHADGTTRLLALWDQRNVGGAGPAPRPYGYGSILGPDQINAALGRANPYTALGYHPADTDHDGRGSHGMHVVDIAVGNGRAGGPSGMAPEADVVFVHLANRDTRGLATLGDSVRILEAVDFVFRLAGDRPCVVNVSAGQQGGPHDGRTLCEQALDHALRAQPNRFVCQSGGNYFGKAVHASGRLSAGEVRPLVFVTHEADFTPNELEVWYSGDDVLVVQVESPTGARTPWVRLGEHVDLVDDGRPVGRIYHRACDPNNHDNQINLFLDEVAPSGRWVVTLQAETARHGIFHAWLERDQACRPCQAHFVAADADDRTTTGTIANGHLPLVVGAYDAHSPGRELASFSSSGPTRDGRLKPDLVAPGVQVLAARSAPPGSVGSPGLLTRKSGTSMAAPHVAGAVALCLQASPHPLTAQQVRALVLGSATYPGGDPQTTPRLGHGYLDIGQLVADATALAPGRPIRPPLDLKEPEMTTDLEQFLPHADLGPECPECGRAADDANANDVEDTEETDAEADDVEDTEETDAEALVPSGLFRPGGAPGGGPPKPRVVFLPGLLGSVLNDSSLTPDAARQLCEQNLGRVGRALLKDSALYPCDENKRPEALWGEVGSLHWIFGPGSWGKRMKSGDGFTDPGTGRVRGLLDLEVKFRKRRVEFKPYTGFVKALQDEGFDVLVFPYDWRLSVHMNVVLLQKQVLDRWFGGKLRTDRRPDSDERVTFIGHSLGGLIARAFIESHHLGHALTKRLITIGTPHVGAPLSYLYLIGRLYPFGDNPFYRAARQVIGIRQAELGVAAAPAGPEMSTQVIPGDIQKSVLNFMASTFELLPTYEFVLKSGRIEGLDETYRDEKHSGTGRPARELLDHHRRFLRRELDLDAWLAQQGIDYHFVAAAGFSTPYGYNRDKKKIIVSKDGDGTVPVRSSHPLPASGNRVRQKLLPKGRLSHARLCERPDTLAYCLQVMGGQPAHAAVLRRDLQPEDLVEAADKILAVAERDKKIPRGLSVGIVLSVVRLAPRDADTVALIDTRTEPGEGGRPRLANPPTGLSSRQVEAVSTSRYGSLEYVWMGAVPNARMQSGGLLFLPLADERELHLVTFNVGPISQRYKDSCTNEHHAEMQLDRWLKLQNPRWRERIAKLEVLNRSRSDDVKGYSPCNACCDDLQGLPAAMKHPSKPLPLAASIGWVELYTKGPPGCRHETDRVGLGKLTAGGWILDGPMP